LQVEVYNAAHQRIHSQELRVQVHNPPRLKSDPLPSSRAADNLGQTAATPPAIARSTPKRSGPADGTRHTENPAIPSPPPTAEWVQPPSPVKNAQGTVPSATAPGVPGQPEPAERVSHSPAPAVSPSPSNEGWSFPPTPGKPAEPSSAWLTNLKRQPRQPCFLMFIYKAAVSIVTQTYLIGEKVFAPVRLIFEGIGAQVQWDAATRILQIHHLGVEIILPPDGHELLVDGQPVPLSAPIFIENGWAMMHVRMLEEILPAKVRWRYDLRRVDVILPQEK